MQTPLWQAMCARFMPPVSAQGLPGELLARFAGDGGQALARLLCFLAPITVRAATLPLVFRLPGSEGLPRGSHVRARVAGIDLLTLELHAVLLARIDGAPAGMAGVSLFLLPRLGQPLLTAAVGVTATAIAVGAMRKMSYSPVKFTTRVHRISRLYTSPISVSTGDEMRAVNTVSTVRPQIDILDLMPAPARAVRAPRPRHAAEPAFIPTSDPDGWPDMFGQQRSAAAELFG